MLNQENMLFGQLNKEIKLLEYIGKDTDTANVTVDGKAQTIAVDVKKVPNKLVITEDSTGEDLTHEFNGSSETNIDLTGYINESELDEKIEETAKDIQTKLDAKRDKIVRGETTPKMTLVYSQNTNGAESSIPTTTSAVAGSIPIRNDRGQVVGNSGAMGNEYITFGETIGIANTKVAKITVASGNPARVYGVNSNGETSIPVDKSALANAIAWRNQKGNLVGNEATDDDEYAPLSQVNTVVQKASTDLEKNIDKKLDNKVDKLSADSSYAKIYAVNTAGGQDYFRSSQDAVDNSTTNKEKNVIPRRTDNGQIWGPNQKTYLPADDQYITKRYGDNSYLGLTDPAIVSGTLFYAVDSEGQKTVEGAVYSNKKGVVVLRQENGQLSLPDQYGNPPANHEAVSASYVADNYASLARDNAFAGNLTTDGKISAKQAPTEDIDVVRLQDMNTALNNKVDKVSPSDETLVYAITPQGKEMGIKTGIGYTKGYGIVQRTSNGQIAMPNQSTYPPTDDQCVTKRYADLNYEKLLSPSGSGDYLYQISVFGTSKHRGFHVYGDSANPYYIVKRTSTRQINLPNQITFAPSIDQAISRRYAEQKFLPLSGGTVSGNLSIQGDLTVSGTTTTEKEKQLLVEDNVIATNANKIDLQTLLSGLAINKNENATYGIMYDPSDDTVKFGEGTLDADNKFVFKAGEGHPLAIRADSAAFTDAHLVKWDAASNSFVDAGTSVNEITDLITASTTAIETEATRATNAENDLKDSITTETTRATEAETALGTRIDNNTTNITTETNRAKGEEAKLQTAIDNKVDKDELPTIGSSTSSTDLKKIVYTAEANIPTAPETGVEYACTDLIGEEDLDPTFISKVNSKQNLLTFDTTPTSGSTNPVTSGGIYNAISKFLTIQVSDSLIGD